MIYVESFPEVTSIIRLSLIAEQLVQARRSSVRVYGGFVEGAQLTFEITLGPNGEMIYYHSFFPLVEIVEIPIINFIYHLLGNKVRLSTGFSIIM